MRKPLRACAAASLIAAFPIAAHAVAQVTQMTPTSTTRPPPATTPAPETPVAVINPIGARLVLEPVPVVDGISAYGERVPGATAALGAPAPAAGLAAPSIEFSEVDLDRAVRRETRRTQRKVARNEQRLYTITPRTAVDRGNEMPDDPVSPAISPPERGRIQY
jgi:hypothetical protein